jgi:hypothetical protein
MNASTLRTLRLRAESGAGGVTFQVIGYTYLLVVLLGLVYDFGAVALTQVVLKSAVVTASQQLTRRYVDRSQFLNDQQVRVEASQITIANAQAEADLVVGFSSTMSAPKVVITNVILTGNQTTDFVEVKGYAIARLPVLNGLLGIPPVTINASAIASPEFGITGTNQ